MEQFKHAIVYGRSVKHQPQRVGLSHELADEDISKSLFTFLLAIYSNLVTSHDCQTINEEYQILVAWLATHLPAPRLRAKREMSSNGLISGIVRRMVLEAA